MKIKSIHLKDFKRFTDLKIEGIPETAKLVVMIGPNGCGKSSVFDALKLRTYLGRFVEDAKISENYYQILDYYFKIKNSQGNFSYEPSYGSSHFRHLHQTPIDRMYSYPSYTHFKHIDYRIRGGIVINLHGREPSTEDELSNNVLLEAIQSDKNNLSRDGEQLTEFQCYKCIRVRTAYRNSSMQLPSTIDRINPKEERKLINLINNDDAISSNYWWLASQWLERSSEFVGNAQNLVDLQNEIFGVLRDAMSRLFNDPPLILKNLGNPLDGDLFQFDKGTSERFSFQNLASGEKAALDLLLDVIVTKEEWDETINCIDEPELHIHTKLQGQLLEELYNLISPKSQLWIATHSIGMVRKAQDLWRDDPDSVVFLDFGKDDIGQDRNFDEQVTIKPANPNPNLWEQTYDVALGDLSELIASEQYVFCEGEDFDEDCYQNIFGSHHPETRFISIGGRNNVEKMVTALKGKIAKGAKVIGVVDRDRATEGEIARDAVKGIRTLSRKSIESYLLDDEVLTKLCEKHGKQDRIQELLTAKTNSLNKRMAEGKSKSPDDLKPIAQDIHVAAQGIVESVPMGNNKDSFMKDILAKLIQPGMAVYEELDNDIFGE